MCEKMAAQFILPPAVTQTPTVTDLVNRASVLLQSSSFILSESPLSSKTSTTLGNEESSEVKLTAKSQEFSVTEAAEALVSTAITFSEVTTALADSGVTQIDHPLTRVFGILAFIISTLETICRALADILRAPFLAEIVSEAAAKAVVSAAMAAEVKAGTLVKGASLLAEVTVEQIERSVGDRKVPLSQSNTEQQMEFSSEGENGDHRNTSTTPSLTQHEMCETRNSKSGILEKFGYTLEEVIGYGKFSVIKAAHSKIHNRKVAVKVVTKSEVPQLYKEKFLPREIQVAQILNHCNIIKFFQVIETNHCVYFVTEYTEGGSLRDAIRKEKINENRARRWFRQLVEAVNYCHKLGITHRDIKCENVLLDAEDNIKLTEFYFARVREASARENSLSYTFCGTEECAAPEILQHTPYDPAISDVWSMGVILFVIMYNQLPFTPKDVDLFRQASNYVLTFPTEPEVTSRYKNLITKMLSPESSRINVETILYDPWFSNESTISVNSKSEAYNRQLQIEPQSCAEDNIRKRPTERQNIDEEMNRKRQTEQRNSDKKNKNKNENRHMRSVEGNNKNRPTELQNGDKEEITQLSHARSDGRSHVSRLKSAMKNLTNTKAARVVSKSVNDMEEKIIQFKAGVKNHV